MCWKKNAFSFFIWLLYIVLAGTSLICTSAIFVDNMGYVPQYGILCAGVIALVEGLFVWLVHRKATSVAGKAGEHRQNIWPWICEAFVILAFLAVGIWRRVYSLNSIVDINDSLTYYELAKVVSGQSIPQIVHGAVYLYLQLLHLLFMFLGNKIAMAFWMQLILQLFAIFVLYRAVRRLVGKIPSVIVFALLMCSTWMVKEVLYLSPNMMLLLCFAIVLWVISLAAKISNVRLWVWPLIGVLVAAVSYMDIIGLTLLLPIIGVLFSKDNFDKDNIKSCFSALGMSILGAVIGFLGLIAVDAFVSGKSILNVLCAWMEVYLPGDFRVLYALENVNFYLLLENVIIFTLFLVGIFTYWCRREVENISLWMCGIVLVIFAQCFQFTTAEVDGSVFLYVFIAILTSIGIAGLFAVDTEELSQMADEIIKDIEVMDVEEMTTMEEEHKKAGVEFIRNPLPLPKKHEKKILDYAVELANDDDFDIEIDENDDFDI